MPSRPTRVWREEGRSGAVASYGDRDHQHAAGTAPSGRAAPRSRSRQDLGEAHVARLAREADVQDRRATEPARGQAVRRDRADDTRHAHGDARALQPPGHASGSRRPQPPARVHHDQVRAVDLDELADAARGRCGRAPPGSAGGRTRRSSPSSTTTAPTTRQRDVRGSCAMAVATEARSPTARTRTGAWSVQRKDRISAVTAAALVTASDAVPDRVDGQAEHSHRDRQQRQRQQRARRDDSQLVQQRRRDGAPAVERADGPRPRRSRARPRAWASATTKRQTEDQRERQLDVEAPTPQPARRCPRPPAGSGARAPGARDHPRCARPARHPRRRPDAEPATPAVRSSCAPGPPRAGRTGDSRTRDVAARLPLPWKCVLAHRPMHQRQRRCDSTLVYPHHVANPNLTTPRPISPPMSTRVHLPGNYAPEQGSASPERWSQDQGPVRPRASSQPRQSAWNRCCAAARPSSTRLSTRVGRTRDLHVAGEPLAAGVVGQHEVGDVLATGGTADAHPHPVEVPGAERLAERPQPVVPVVAAAELDPHRLEGDVELVVNHHEARRLDPEEAEPAATTGPPETFM